MQPSKEWIERQDPHRLKPIMRASKRYGSALLSVACAFAVQSYYYPRIHTAPFLFFHAAVFVSVWNGGFGPGFLATCCCTFLSARFFLGAPPSFVLRFQDWVALTGFFGVS